MLSRDPPTRMMGLTDGLREAANEKYRILPLYYDSQYISSHVSTPLFLIHQPSARYRGVRG